MAFRVNKELLPPATPRRHSKNVLESKHVIIRSCFLTIKDATPDIFTVEATEQATCISNDLYGSKLLPALRELM